MSKPGNPPTGTKARNIPRNKTHFLPPSHHNARNFLHGYAKYCAPETNQRHPHQTSDCHKQLITKQQTHSIQNYTSWNESCLSHEGKE